MEKINNLLDLKARIDFLETKQEAQELELKQEFEIVCEQVKPANLLKNGIQGLLKSPGLKGQLLDGAMGLVSGLVSGNLVGGIAGGPIKAVLGTIVQSVVGQAVAKNAGPVRSAVQNAITNFLNKKEKPKE